MPEKSRLRVALIGLGKIAQKAYLPILANHPEVEPILCTRNTQTLQQLARRYRIDECYSDIDELIRNKPDAAMVHSSTSSHTAIASQMLNAGIPVFVDKPLSFSLADAEKVLKLASQKQLPLYLGFNRRFAPLIKSFSTQPDPQQISWHKNRTNEAGDPRVFIFDDFIHVIDSLRFLGKGPVENLQVQSIMQDGKLENVQIQWNQGSTLLYGGMNRRSGLSEERIEYYTKGNKWVVNNLNSGVHFSEKGQTHLGFDNWDPTLFKRGFVDMIDDWLAHARNHTFSPDQIQDAWETHHLCEEIVNQVLGN